MCSRLSDYSCAPSLTHLSQPDSLPAVPGLEENSHIDSALVCNLFFGTPHISHYADLQAFVYGMTCALAPSDALDKVRVAGSLHESHPNPFSPPSSQTFNSRCRDFLAVLCNQRLRSVDALLSRVFSRSDLDAEAIASQGARSESLDDDPTWDLVYEQGFDLRLREYLSGVGHPNHPNVIAVIGVDRFEREADDPLLRARLFLKAVTGSDLVPLDPKWSIQVRVIACDAHYVHVLMDLPCQFFYSHGDGPRRVPGSKMVLDAPIPAPVRPPRHYLIHLSSV